MSLFSVAMGAYTYIQSRQQVLAKAVYHHQEIRGPYVHDTYVFAQPYEKILPDVRRVADREGLREVVVHSGSPHPSDEPKDFVFVKGKTSEGMLLRGAPYVNPPGGRVNSGAVLYIDRKPNWWDKIVMKSPRKTKL